MPGRRLNSQAQQMVLNLLEYFENEKKNGGPVNCKIYFLCSPTNKSFNQKIAKHVTVKTLNQELRRKEIVYFGRTSLRPLLTELGFKYKKEDNRSVLTEKTAISAKRGEFLRKFQENKHSSLQRDVVFLDETWIYNKGSKRKSWWDQSVKSVRKPEGYDGKRFIILHAGNSKGFIKDAGLLFASQSKVADYHGEMNSTIFTKWVQERLILNLQEPSLIVMDNAPYHSTLVKKQPSTSSRRLEIIEWLKKYNITYNDKMTAAELLSFARMNKKEEKYVIDDLLREHGHDVLRLPPQHCEFNTIELIWAKAKGYYNDNIGRDGYTDDKVIDMWREALQTCNENVWNNCVRHTEKIITGWYEREQYMINCVVDIPPVTIQVNPASSSSVSDSDFEADST